MTRINLLRNTGRIAQPSFSGSSTQTSTRFADGEARPAGLVVKIIAALALPGMLYYYETTSISEKRSELNRMQQELTAVESQLQSKASVAEVLKQYSAEKARLENQMETVRELNKKRLREIKALDKLQDLLPAKVWLSKLSIRDKVMKIEGFSMGAEDISAFIRELEQSAFFKEVLLTSSTEEQNQTGAFKKFELSCGVEGN